MNGRPKGLGGLLPETPLAFNDFYKTNGLDPSVHRVMPVGPSLTRQEFADECDINKLMSRYDQYLADPMRSVRQPMYYDFSEGPQTLMEFMDVMKRGETAFMSLPASVRKEFDNDAVQFVEFASDPDNLEQMREWGLAKPAEKPVLSSSPPPAPGGAVQAPPAAADAPAASAAAPAGKPAGAAPKAP